MIRDLSRRGLLQSATGAALLSALPAATAHGASSGKPSFLWGAASAGHQVEGGNINADSWLLEHMPSTLYADRSGDAADHYSRFQQDIALLAGLGLNTFRFSLEWSRIEPEPGEFSQAVLGHYRRVLAACHEHGVVPMVTFNHFTNPRWFAARGGWMAPDAATPFLRYCETASRALGDLIGVATTFNEPQLARMIGWGRDMQALEAKRTRMLEEAAKAMNSSNFHYYLSGEPAQVQQAMIAAHHRAYVVIKCGPGAYPVGVSLAMSDDQAVGDPARRDAKRAWCYDDWLHAAGKSDFVGVQAYTRALVGPSGPLPAPAEAEKTAIGWEFYPAAIGGAVRYAAKVSGGPVIVTENGVAIDDDSRRIAYIDGALASLRQAVHDGVDLRGYIHWSFLDTFEWSSGYRPKFGLVEVDRSDFSRKPRPSAGHLGTIAQAKSW